MNIFAAVTVTALTLSLAVEPAKAAVIAWGTPTNIVDQNDVDTTGTLFASANFWQTGADVGSGNITVNGVQFDGFQSATATPASGPTSLTVGNITLTGTSPLTNYVNLQGFTGAGGPASYNGLLNQLAFVYNTNTTGTMGVSIGGLTNGAQYLIQFWVNDSRGTAPVPTRTTLVDGNSLAVNTTQTSGGIGQYITGTFTADSTTQSFPVIGGVGSVAYANAMQVRIVPEPTQMVSVAAIGAALGMWRTRKLRRNGRGSDATAC